MDGDAVLRGIRMNGFPVKEMKNIYSAKNSPLLFYLL